MERLNTDTPATQHSDLIEALDALARAPGGLPVFVTVPAPALTDGHVEALSVQEIAA